MSPTTAILLVLGLGLLIVGAELLVRGASRLAAAAGISPLVIGLTVVAFGTSSPELAVSLKAGWAGQGDIAIGNVVGSNILNVLFILGIAAVITPLTVAAPIVRRDTPLMIVASVVMALMALDGRIGRTDGLLLTAAMIAYTTWVIRQSRREMAAAPVSAADGDPPARAAGALARNAAFAAAGLVLLVLGARWLVDGAVAVATALGISELVIGLTVVALGTSAPEVATSIVAAARGQRDIAVGNVVGSNIANILGVLGPTALVSPRPIAVSSAAMVFDIPVMIAVAVGSLPVFYTGGRIARGEGWLLLGYYAAYTAFLVLTAHRHDALRGFTLAMALFVIPITALALAVTVFREWSLRRG
jgi:cation:H+ antiporter